MTKQLQTALKHYTEKMNLLKALSSAQALLSWDRETHLPKGAAADRGFTLATIAGLSHEIFTDKKFVNAVQTLFEGRTALSPEWQRSVTLMHRELQKSIKLSKAFVEETNQIVNAGYTAWLEAKQTSNFALFQPHLEKIVENRKAHAHFLDPHKNPYDICLDDYEEGLNTNMLVPVFAQLKTGLREVLPKILKRQKSWKNPLEDVELNHQELNLFLQRW